MNKNDNESYRDFVNRRRVIIDQIPEGARRLGSKETFELTIKDRERITAREVNNHNNECLRQKALNEIKNASKLQQIGLCLIESKKRKIASICG